MDSCSYTRCDPTQAHESTMGLVWAEASCVHAVVILSVYWSAIDRAPVMQLLGRWCCASADELLEQEARRQCSNPPSHHARARACTLTCMYSVCARCCRCESGHEC